MSDLSKLLLDQQHHMSSVRKVNRLRRYGSRKVKTLIRQFGSNTPREIVSIIKVMT